MTVARWAWSAALPAAALALAQAQGARQGLALFHAAFGFGGSLHGWVWIAPALLGNWVGLRLRPLFGLGPGGHAGVVRR